MSTINKRKFVSIMLHIWYIYAYLKDKNGNSLHEPPTL